MSKKKRTNGKNRVRPRLRITCGGRIALGPGKVELLELLHSTGSIARAAKRMDMSYMRAWTLIGTMNACFKKPLVVTERGGRKGGGGAMLTATGRRVLALYHQMQVNCLDAVQPAWRNLKRLLP